MFKVIANDKVPAGKVWFVNRRVVVGKIINIEMGGSMSKQSSKRSELPEVLETDIDEREKVVLLIQEGMELKDRLNAKIRDEEYDSKIHLARRLEEIKEELNAIQESSGVNGLRHNQFVFIASLQNGRSTIDMTLLEENLLLAGVRASVIHDCIKAATKQGNSYWKRDLVELK